MQHCINISKSPHRQLVIEALDLDDEAVLPGHQLVLQLGHVRLIGRLGQVVRQDVHKEVEQHQAEQETTRASRMHQLSRG